MMYMSPIKVQRYSASNAATQSKYMYVTEKCLFFYLGLPHVFTDVHEIASSSNLEPE